MIPAGCSAAGSLTIVEDTRGIGEKVFAVLRGFAPNPDHGSQTSRRPRCQPCAFMPSLRPVLRVITASRFLSCPGPMIRFAHARPVRDGEKAGV